MRRILLMAAGLGLFCAGGMGQSTASDSKTLQDLLGEVRQLRQDLHATTAAVQRAQILLHRVDTQAYVVRTLRERVDGERGMLEQLRTEQKNRTEMIKQIEEKLESNPSIADRKSLEETLFQLKNAPPLLDEQEAQAKLSEEERELRTEEAKLADLEERLDRLDKELESEAGKK
jgi:chromosome segregation ATPase